MGWKKLLNKLLFPHIAIMIILIPIATAFLVYSMVFLFFFSVVAIISYVFATYTLTVWCLKIPHLIHFSKPLKKKTNSQENGRTIQDLD